MPSIDTQIIKDTVNVRDLIGRDLGKPRTSNNKYDLYRCALHHENKGYSLAVYEDHWQCFGKCSEGGDAIKWMERYHHMTFHEACTALLGNSIRQSQPRPQIQKPVEKTEPPSEEWQHYANQVVERAIEILWSPEGKPAMDYLRITRGLGPLMIMDAKLGYIPGSHDQWHIWNKAWLKENNKLVRVPAGISIPHYAQGKLWGVRVRRSSGDIKYQGIPGGVKCLYGVDEVLPGMDVFITEGEFDCLIMDECAGDLVCPVSLCSAANHHIDSRWLMTFVSASNVYARLDDDEAGHRAAAALGKFTQCLRLVQVPEGKDVNEFYLSHGFRGVRNWVKELLAA